MYKTAGQSLGRRASSQATPSHVRLIEPECRRIDQKAVKDGDQPLLCALRPVADDEDTQRDSHGGCERSELAHCGSEEISEDGRDGEARARCTRERCEGSHGYEAVVRCVRQHRFLLRAPTVEPYSCGSLS